MEGFLNSLMQHWPGVLFRQRPDLSFDVASPRLEELTGRALAEWQRQPGLIWQALHEQDVEGFKNQLFEAGQRPGGSTHSFRLRHASTGRVAHLSEFRRAQQDAGGGLLYYEGFWLDVTRQTLAERRLSTAAWQETLGLLTLGLAHDFNNVLAGILGLSQTFLCQIEPAHPFHEGLVLIQRRTQQAAQLIERIAQLHRGKTGTRAYKNLNDVVQEGIELLGPVMPGSIELVTQLEPATLPLYVDGLELQQLLINLALNGADAMPERGQLTIRTSRHETLPSLEHHVGVLPRLPAASLTVIDTGSGIASRLLPLVFDPFFTTKPMNRGSGLGLYHARLFAEKHQGAISVQSQEGAGSSFHLWLPLADFTEADHALELFTHRRRTLLLAGHAGQLLDSTAEVLRQNGYQVVAGGAYAEDLLRSSDYQFDGVLLLAERQDPQAASLARLVRQQKMPVKVIVKTVGCQPDELEAQLLGRADLIISADLPADAILDRLAATLDWPGRP